MLFTDACRMISPTLSNSFSLTITCRFSRSNKTSYSEFIYKFNITTICTIMSICSCKTYRCTPRNYNSTFTRECSSRHPHITIRITITTRPSFRICNSISIVIPTTSYRSIRSLYSFSRFVCYYYSSSISVYTWYTINTILTVLTVFTIFTVLTCISCSTCWYTK